MASTLDAEFFLEFCIRVFSRQENGNFFHFSQDVEPINFRMRRFQLFAELFHQPGDDSCDTGHYEPFEVEECKCICYLLVECLRANMGKKILWPGQDEDLIQHRGLPQLRNFIEDDVPYTKFGLSYVRRFLTKALGDIVCVMESDIRSPGLRVRGGVGDGNQALHL
ncbi:hypothetical protein VTN00DRAFT_7561 [Thermoascus crustaceus]|uniref:uncharacterized protein n=1 Tax=Thermoascus crustaceus TaxID=5088 RepID=UPI0037423456